MRPTPTAMRRCVGVASLLIRTGEAVGLVEFGAAPGIDSMGMAEGCVDGVVKNEAGWAIMTTPTKETRPAICSMRVKGSWTRTEQAQQAINGARKVMTVASAIGR